MPYAKKHAKSGKSHKCPRKKAAITKKPKHVYGPHKSHTSTAPAYTQTTNSASRQAIFDASIITPGTLYNTRTTNTIWMNNIQFFLNVRNAASTSRYIRIIALTLQNATQSPAGSFTDIYTTGDFVTEVGATGLAEDTLYRINRAHYKPLYDKVLKIPGTANGESNSKNYKFNIPIKKYVSYDYNSVLVRKNPVFLLWQLCEAEGVATSAVVMAESYRITTHFKDVLN